MKRQKLKNKQNLGEEDRREVKAPRKIKKNQRQKFQEDESLKELKDNGF